MRRWERQAHSLTKGLMLRKTPGIIRALCIQSPVQSPILKNRDDVYLL
jgi:hypothetical protein